MGNSDPENKPWTINKIVELNPKTVLDIGPGKGIYLDLIRRDLGDSVIVDAVEVWQPYVDEFDLHSRYNHVEVQDIRDYEFNKEYDLIIFGDILEHMSEKDAVEVWKKVSKASRYAIISIPIIHYHQDAANGNPYEIHVEEDWNSERVLRCFNGIVEHQEFPITGVFVAKFKE
jgi:cyclopropane fatty-acyl-phospholipid synthase-like methyltransferase